MRFVLGVIATLLSVTSCSGKKVESRQAEQPTEVSGGFGLTMQCSVLNRKDTNASSSSVGCLVFNDDGTPFKGSISDTSAEVVTSTGQVITASQVVSDENTTGFSVFVDVTGLKPADAATIRVSGMFDGKSLVLVASLKEFATTCSQDLSLFVDATAPATNRLCSATEKCQTISKALELLPDIINCAVTIDVAKGLYQESIRIDDKVVRRSGLLTINGAMPGADGLHKTTLTNDVIDSGTQFSTRGIVITGLTSGVSASIPVFELRNFSLQLNPATDPKDGPTYGLASQSSNFKLENVKISGFDSAIFAPTVSSVYIKNLVVENAKSGLYARNPTNVILAGDISFNGADKSAPLSVGIQFDSPSLLNIGRVDDPLVSLKIENFYQGIRLLGTITNFRGGEKINIQNVHHGIAMFESSALRLPNLATVTPVELSVKNFTGTGIFLANSSITDGESTNWAAIVPSASHSLKLEGSPDAFMMWATDSGVIDLTRTNFNFCFKSFTSSTHTKTPSTWNTSDSIYALAVDSDSEARFSWATNPFTTGETCSSSVSPQKLHIKRYKYRFAATTSGVAKLCPAGYVLQSDDFCYGALGYARHTAPEEPTDDPNHTFFGVLQSDSRIDDLQAAGP